MNGSAVEETTARKPRTASVSSRMARAVDAAPVRCFAVLTLFYFICTFTLSSMKLLWLDELITLHLARIGSVAGIWQALSQGADPNPPVTHILVHASRKLFGEHEYALRLPAMVGDWVGLLSLFLYLRRRLTPTWALAGTVLSMTMAAFDYSYESRSYAIFYGLAMLAFFCWSSAVDAAETRGRQTLYLGGLLFALACGISTNYFAVLAFLPAAAGELTRSFLRLRRGAGWSRAIDFRVWVVLLAGALPLLAYRSMMEHSIAQFAPYAWNKVKIGEALDGYTEMVEIVLYPLLALFVLVGVVWLLARLSREGADTAAHGPFERWIAASRMAVPRVPAYEAVGILFLMSYPFLGYAIASIHGGMLSPRFVIPVCFGFAIAGTLAAFRLFGHLPRAGAVMLCFVLLWFIARESYVGYWYEEQKQCFYKVIDRLPEAERSVPPGAAIAVPDPLMALTFQHYAPHEASAREVFPIDFAAIRRIRGDDSPEENILAGRNRWYTLNIMPLADLQHTQGRYLVLASDGNWMLGDLDEHHYGTRRLPIDTRAQAIGGFTPLSRGTPAFFTADGEGVAPGPLMPEFLPVPFPAVADLLPSGAGR